jgi:hypothetical protein
MDPNMSSPEGRGRLQGRYANYFEIGCNAYEFVFDFCQRYGENDDAELCTRIITSPVYAAALLETLKESIGQYELQFGPIATPRNSDGDSR